MTAAGACACFTRPGINAHEGHCCCDNIPTDYRQGDELPCGHRDQAFALWAAYKRSLNPDVSMSLINGQPDLFEETA